VLIQPNSAPPSSTVVFSGSGLPANQAFDVLWDGTQLAQVNTDGGGNFTANLAIPDNATGAGHTICVHELPGNVCGTFTLEAKPTPAPSPTDTPSPSPSPSPSPPLIAVAPPAGSGGISALALLSRPPFIFLPILAIVGLLAFLGIWIWRMRPTPPLGEVTVLHRAPAPREHELLPDTPPAPPPAQARPAPIGYQSAPGQSAAPPPPLTPPAPPSGADVPPDLPQPTD
jgi:hypothetical protein